MNKTNFIPYSFIEKSLIKEEKILKLIFFITFVLIFLSISIIKSNMNRLSDLKMEEEIFIEKVHDINLKEHNKEMRGDIEALCQIIKDNNNFYFITLKNNTLWIEGMDKSIKNCKKTVINLEQNSSFKVISLKGPEKKEDNYYYKVGVALNAK